MCVLLLRPQVNIPHLLHYAASFDHDNDALIIGHVIDGVWTRVHGFSGGAGMLISRKALSIFGCALSTGTMPLPPQGESSSSSTRHTAQQAQQSHLPPSTLSLPTLLKGALTMYTSSTGQGALTYSRSTPTASGTRRYRPTQESYTMPGTITRGLRAG